MFNFTPIQTYCTYLGLLFLFNVVNSINHMTIRARETPCVHIPTPAKKVANCHGSEKYGGCSPRVTWGNCILTTMDSKHEQGLLLFITMTLCDCPGSSRADLHMFLGNAHVVILLLEWHVMVGPGR